jgi:hypothetical protein
LAVALLAPLVIPVLVKRLGRGQHSMSLTSP